MTRDVRLPGPADRAEALKVSSYNDTAVIAGQSTIGAELDAQASGGLTVVCPVGGGGLLTGLALWAAQRSDVDLIGVEPHASRALSAAIAAGRVVSVETQPTLSDGTAGNIEDGSITWPVIRDRVSEIVHVDEAEIAEAIRFLAAEHGLVAEGSGALATAALLAGKVTVRRQPVALLSGRNIPVVTLSRVLGEP